MKTKEDLNALKEEVVILNKKLGELTKDELKKVTGGIDYFVPYWYCPNPKCPRYNVRNYGYMESNYCETCGTRHKLVLHS